MSNTWLDYPRRRSIAKQSFRHNYFPKLQYFGSFLMLQYNCEMNCMKCTFTRAVCKHEMYIGY